ncbi:MAG: hypothetical protein RLZZ245_1807 [Verrucomicrobiota bacterium]
MKATSILTHVIALCLPIAAIAQERVTIDGILSDGTPPPPPPSKVQHEFKILSTEEIPLERRKMIINRVEDPGFPDPTPPPPAVIDPATVAAFKSSPAYLEWQEKQQRTTSLFLSASVVDNRATLLRWWEGGKEYQAWSNVDFKYLTGFASFSKGDRSFVTFMGVGDVSAASLRAESMFQAPADLPTGVPDFRMIQGAAGESEGYDAIVALHELYATDGEGLRAAYQLREARRKEAEAELRANPPVPKDIVLNFWKVEPPKKEAEAQAPRFSKTNVEGAAAQ